MQLAMTATSNVIAEMLGPAISEELGRINRLPAGRKSMRQLAHELGTNEAEIHRIIHGRYEKVDDGRLIYVAHLN